MDESRHNPLDKEPKTGATSGDGGAVSKGEGSAKSVPAHKDSAAPISGQTEQADQGAELAGDSQAQELDHVTRRAAQTLNLGSASVFGTASAWGRTTQSAEAEEEAELARLRNIRLELLGEGGQGKVFLVKHLGQLEAHKFLNRPRAGRSVFREALHTRMVSHPNIVQVFGTEEIDNAAVLRMEYVEGRDLSLVLEEEGPLSVAELAPLALSVIEALQVAHEAGIVHQDLKPSNLILRQDRSALVLTDFGVSAALRNLGDANAPLELKARGGTPAFMAPELLDGSGEATPRADIWSLGVTLYFLVSGQLPFPFDEFAPVEAVRQPARALTEWDHVPQGFWDVVKRAFALTPEDGYESMADFGEAMRTWLQDLSCPQCQKVVAREVSQCPHCKSPKWVWQRAGLQQRTDGETALALCRWEEARAAFERAGTDFQKLAGDSAGQVHQGNEASFAQQVQHCGSLARRSTELAEQCEGQLAVLDLALDEARLVDAVHGYRRTAERFSHAPELRELKQRLERLMRELYLQVEPNTRSELRHGRFEAARSTLGQLQAVLADSHSRDLLRSSLAEDPKQYEWLAEEIRRKEELFESITDETRQGIECLDFDRALQAVARLEDEFPSEENVFLMQRLRRSGEALLHAQTFHKDWVAALQADPLGAPAAGLALEPKEPSKAKPSSKSPSTDSKLDGLPRPLDVRAAQDSCRVVLADFPVATHPAMKGLQELERGLERAGEQIRAVVIEKLQIAETAEEEARIKDALEALDDVHLLVAESDLFDAEVRERWAGHRSRLSALAARAGTRFRDGMVARDAREYAKSLLALGEVLDTAPLDYPEAAEQIAAIEIVRDRTSNLSEEVSREFSEIRAGRFTADSARLSLQHAESLFELADDSRRGRLTTELGEVLEVLLGSQVLCIRQLEQDPGSWHNPDQGASTPNGHGTPHAADQQNRRHVSPASSGSGSKSGSRFGSKPGAKPGSKLGSSSDSSSADFGFENRAGSTNAVERQPHEDHPVQCHTAFLRDSVVPLLGGLSYERWRDVSRGRPVLQEQLAVLCASGLPAVAENSSSPTSYAGPSLNLRSGLNCLRARMETLRPLSRHLADRNCEALEALTDVGADSSEASIEPGVEVARAVHRLVRAESRSARREMSQSVARFLRNLEAIVPPARRDDLTRSTDAVRRLGQRASWARFASGLLKVGTVAVPVCLVGCLAWNLGRNRGVEARGREIQEVRKGWVAELFAADGYRFEVEEWLAQNSDEVRRPQQLSLLVQWAELRELLQESDQAALDSSGSASLSGIGDDEPNGRFDQAYGNDRSAAVSKAARLALSLLESRQQLEGAAVELCAALVSDCRQALSTELRLVLKRTQAHGVQASTGADLVRSALVELGLVKLQLQQLQANELGDAKRGPDEFGALVQALERLQAQMAPHVHNATSFGWEHGDSAGDASVDQEPVSVSNSQPNSDANGLSEATPELEARQAAASPGVHAPLTALSIEELLATGNVVTHTRKLLAELDAWNLLEGSDFPDSECLDWARAICRDQWHRRLLEQLEWVVRAALMGEVDHLLPATHDILEARALLRAAGSRAELPIKPEEANEIVREALPLLNSGVNPQPPPESAPGDFASSPSTNEQL